MTVMSQPFSKYRGLNSAFAGVRVESGSESEEDTQLTSAANLLFPKGKEEVCHGRIAMKPHDSPYAHGLFAQPVVVPQTDSKLPFVVLHGSTLFPAANLVQRAVQAPRLAVSSS
jgi:hypothetical protein